MSVPLASRPAAATARTRPRAARGSRTSQSSRTREAHSGKAPPRIDRARLRAILEGLRRAHPQVRCALGHADAFQLLVATILSAQCTDKRVNQVTPELFRRYLTPAALARAPRAEIEGLIRTTGFFRSKARSLQEMSRDLVNHFGGAVPRTMQELVNLQGVGRKTANVVLGTAFGIPSGVVVDTHVRRISRRLGLTRQQDPVRIERDLMAILPLEEWIDFSHRIIWHGRLVCRASRPRCEICELSRVCPAGEKELRRRARELASGARPVRRAGTRARTGPARHARSGARGASRRSARKRAPSRSAGRSSNPSARRR